MIEVTGWHDRLDAYGRPLALGIAGLLALLIAWIHLLHPRLGLPRLLLYIELGTLYDPRPPLFVASAIVIFLGIVTWFYTDRRNVLYAGGIVLVIVYTPGYVAWHTVLEHGAFWPHIEAHAHHETGTLETVFNHLRNDPLALLSKTAELGLGILLAGLFFREGD